MAKTNHIHPMPFGERRATDMVTRLREIADAIESSGAEKVLFHMEQSKGADAAFQYVMEAE